MHFMPFHEGVYKQVEEVFLSDIKQDYIVDASWAVGTTSRKRTHKIDKF